MTDGYLFLTFMDECIVSLTGWVNNYFVYLLFPGEVFINAYTIWLVWVYNLLEATMPVWIIY